MTSAIFVVVILLFIVAQFYNLQISCLLHTVTESISYRYHVCFIQSLRAYHFALWPNNIKPWNVTWDVKSWEVFVCFWCHLFSFQTNFIGFFLGFFLTDLTLQDKQNIHKLFMGELCLFQIVQWFELRGVFLCCWYWWNCWPSLFKLSYHKH